MNAEQLQNLRDLRALGARILAEPERYPLSFGGYDCGTHACWLGHYWRMTGEPFNGWGAPEFGLDDAILVDMFGVAGVVSDNPEADKHGPAAYTELARRLEYLDSLIAEHEPKVEPKGIPSEVRAIFESTAVETP